MDELFGMRYATENNMCGYEVHGIILL